MNEYSYMEALRSALRDEMLRDQDVFVMGEDIGTYGGAFGVTQGLLDEFGKARVIDTPISEGGFTGVAVGAALTGSRPVVEIMFMDFVGLIMDQLLNQASKLRYVLGPQAKCPLVVRVACGAGRCYGPTHSQTLESWLAHIPGLKVVAPSTPADADGLLRAAIRDDNPVVFIEHKLLYGEKGPVSSPSGEPLPIGEARVVQEGDDVTVVAWSWMLAEAERAAAELEEQGVSVDLVDLRCLSPLDDETIIDSVKHTGRLLIVEEGYRTSGMSGEIAMRVFEQAFDYLEAPPRRLTSPDIPIPASPILEKAAVPNSESIVATVKDLMTRQG